MNSNDYWRERFEQLEESLNQDIQNKMPQIDRIYREAERDIEKEILAWYQRLAENNGISMAEARKLLDKDELEEFHWDVEEYIKRAQENAVSKEWVKELENASAKFHISRLEALKLNTQQSLETVFGNQLDMLDKLMREQYEESYYRTAFEVQRGFNVGWPIGRIDQDKLDKILSKPWAPDGRNFSERIWNNRAKLVNEIHSELARMCITGEGPDRAIEAISKKMNTSRHNAGRLVMTESAYFDSAARKDAFGRLGVERYEIVATLDARTSEICQEMDGKVFDMKDYEAGVTAPPFHVYCRSCTCPYFDDEFGEIGERAARDADGETYYVPADMTYKDWEKAFVKGGSKEGFALSGSAARSVQLGNSLEGYTDGQKAEIVHLLDSAPQEIKDAFAKYGGQFREVAGNLNKSKSIAPAYFDPADGRVHMDRQRAAAGSDYEAVYQQHFHEYAHNLDYLAGHGGYASRSWRSKGGETFEDIIKKDWDAALKNHFMADAKNSYMHGLEMQFHAGGQGGETYLRSMLTNWRQINRLSRHDSAYLDLKHELDALDGTDDSYRTFWRDHFDTFKDMVYNNFVDKKDVLDEFVKDIKLSLSKIERGDISDMFERYAVKIGGAGYERPFGWGHGEQYALTKGNLTMEAFAEMTSAGITNPKSLAQIKKYLPNAYNAYLEILGGMV